MYSLSMNMCDRCIAQDISALPLLLKVELSDVNVVKVYGQPSGSAKLSALSRVDFDSFLETIQ